ncbi:hypothetical protein J6590_040747, partial [Homalodisca vitripennis]
PGYNSLVSILSLLSSPNDYHNKYSVLRCLAECGGRTGNGYDHVVRGYHQPLRHHDPPRERVTLLPSTTSS